MSAKESPRLINRNINAARVIALAQRPEGVITAEISSITGITGMKTSTIGRLMLDLCAEKLIFQAKAHHRFCRYFGTPAEAVKEPITQALAQPPAHVTCGGRWAPDATVTWPTHADGTPAYKLTVAPQLPTGIFRTSTFSN